MDRSRKVILSELIQTSKDKYCVFSYIWILAFKPLINMHATICIATEGVSSKGLEEREALPRKGKQCIVTERWRGRLEWKG